MPIPAGIPTVTCSIGTGFAMESGVALGANVTVNASVPGLVWAATGDPGISDPYTLTIGVGAAMTFPLIPTDLAGWKLNGAVVDVSGGQQAFTYTIVVQWTKTAGVGTLNVGSPFIYRNVVVPQATSGTLDLDLAISTSDAGGVPITLPPTFGGGGGSLLARTAVKAADYTAAAQDLVPVDTTSGAVTVTLPNAPADKAQVAVKHVIQGGTNAVTIAAAGADVFNKAGGSTSLSMPLLAQGVLVQYDAATHVWTVLADDLALPQLDARFATPASASAAAAALDANQRLVSYYGVDETGLPNKPWRPADPIGPELWALANFTAGGAGSSPTPTGTANTTTLSPSATQATSNTTVTTRVLIPASDQAEGGESTYTGKFRLSFDLTSTVTSGPAWEIQLVPRDDSGAGTITYIPASSSNDYSVQPTAHRIQLEADLAPITGNRVRYFDLQIYVPGTGSPSGSVSITNVSLRNIAFVRDFLKVSYDRALPSASAGVVVHMPMGTDAAGSARWVSETFGPDNGSTLVPIGAFAYPIAAMQSPRRVGSPYFSQYATANLHVANSADVINVFKTSTTSEYRGNTHGGEAGQSGTWTTDNVVHVDYGNGTWVPLPSYDQAFYYARRVRIVTHSKITRSDQSSPFCNIDRTFIIYNDGTIRCDKTVTFLQNQQISKWFWHMTSQNVPGAMFNGRIGQAQRVLGAVDYGAKLTVPVVSSLTGSGTGGTIPASATGLPWSVRVTAMNQFGETVPDNAGGRTVATTGTTSSIAAAWGAIAGAAAYAVYFGPPGMEQRVAVVTGTSYTILGSETPTGIKVPTDNTAYTGAQSTAVQAASDVADWSAIREKATGLVYSLSLDRIQAASMGNGVVGIQAQIAAVPGSITKNYWPLDFSSSSPTIPNGATFTGTQWFFFYLPADPVNFEREQTYRAASVSVLPTTLYPST